MKIGWCMSRTPVVCCGFAVWLALTAQVHAAPQGQADSDPAPEQAAQERELIPIGDVPVEAETLEGSLRKIEASLSAAEVVASVQETLKTSQADLEELQDRLDKMLGRHHLPSELEGIRSAWQRFVDQLDAQEGKLREWTGQIEGWLGEKDARLELWTRTRTAAKREKAPRAVMNRIADVSRALGSLEETLKEARNDATALQSRLIAHRRAVQLVADQIDAAKDELAASLLVSQEKPLWSALTGIADLRQQMNAVADGLVVLAEEFWDYVTRNLDRLLFHAFVIVALGVGLRRARKGLRHTVTQAVREVPEPGSALRTLAHPWLSALLLGVVLTPFLHPPERPLAFRLLVGTLSVPVLLLVLRSLIPAVLRLPLLGLAVLALVEVFRLATIEFGALNRLLLMVETATLAAGFWWLRRGTRLEAFAEGQARNPWLRILRGWIWLALLASLAGVLAVILGYMNLANRILMLVLWGTYSAALWFAGLHIAEAVLESVARSGKLDLVRMIRNRRPLFLRWTGRGVRLFAFFGWLYLILVAMQAWGPFRFAIESVLSFRVGVGQVSLSLGGILAFGATLWISWLLARFASFALDQEVFSRARMAPGVPFALRTFTRYTVIVIGFIVAMAVAGFPMDRLTLIVSALGVGIGFGLQGIVNNFVSGIILLSERRIRVGDVVQLDTLSGKVQDIGIRASRIRTFDGSDVIVPNGDLVGARLINWTLSDQKRRLSLPVRVAHGTDAGRMLALLERVAKEHDEVLKDPPPQILFKGFEESSLEFELRAWTESERGWPAVCSDLAVAVQSILAKEGIEIPVPQRDLHVRNILEIKDALGQAIGRAPDRRSS